MSTVDRYSRIFAPTLKESPADAAAISHQLLVRAGFIRQLGAGLYSFLPLGWRSMRNIERILREEMHALGGQEVLLPSLQPSELWRASGRWDDVDETMFRLRDRREGEYCLGMTHEEVVTDLARAELASYRQLPQLWYQIGPKFRDEPRPRGGLLRVREFLMKDAYSFDADAAGLDRQFEGMRAAYERIYARCGIRAYAAEAFSGAMGGRESIEFVVESAAGEDTVVRCERCAYVANVEVATSRVERSRALAASAALADRTGALAVSAVDRTRESMVDRTNQLAPAAADRTGELAAAAADSTNEVAESVVDRTRDLAASVADRASELAAANQTSEPAPTEGDGAGELAASMAQSDERAPSRVERFATPGVRTIDALAAPPYGVAAARQLKTLVYVADGQPVVAVVRGDDMLNEAKLQVATRAGQVRPAEPEDIVRLLGAHPGSLGAVGFAGAPVLVDATLASATDMVTGANTDDVHVRGVDVQRDVLHGPHARLADLRTVKSGEGCPRCDGALVEFSALEVGHIFKLGTRYSEKMGARFLGPDGAQAPLVMGSYGIGVGRLLAAIVEANHDADGIIWPPSVAPYTVAVVQAGGEPEVAALAEEATTLLRDAGLAVLYDDRDERAGVKFKDADLIGIPWRVTVGRRGLADRTVEWRRRGENATRVVGLAELGGLASYAAEAG